MSKTQAKYVYVLEVGEKRLQLTPTGKLVSVLFRVRAERARGRVEAAGLCETILGSIAGGYLENVWPVFLCSRTSV